MKNIAEQITEGLDRFYKAFQRKRVLKSLEEISATTNEDDLASATAVATLSNKLGHGQIEFDIVNGEGFWRAAGADTWNPFSKVMATTYTIATIVGQVANGSIVCKFSGFAYIFITARGNGSNTSLCTVSRNGTAIYNQATGNGNYARIVNVKKSDILSWTMTLGSNCNVICVSCVYPA